jgi:hypothetical protein
MSPRSRGMSCPRLDLVHSQREGAGNAGCTLHPRSRVQWVVGSAHEHTGSAEALRHSLRNGFTAYFVLFPATNSFCHRHQRIEICPSPVGPTRLRWLDISHGCQNHTTSPYAATSRQNADRRRADRKSWRRPLKRRSSARRWIAHGRTRPATTIAPDAAASTASNPASVTIAIRPSCRGGWPKG